VPAGHTDATWLRHLTIDGARARYGPRSDERVSGAYIQLEHELECSKPRTPPMAMAREPVTAHGFRIRPVAEVQPALTAAGLTLVDHRRVNSAPTPSTYSLPSPPRSERHRDTT
jgi:hypothetical protein